MTSIKDRAVELGLRRFQSGDEAEICSWIRSAAEFRLVGSEPSDSLTPTILKRWIRRSLDTIVVTDSRDGRAVGFCTLSTREIGRLPRRHVELCHVIVAPSMRYGPIAFRLLDESRRRAADHDFTRAVGRVVPENTRMLVVAGFKGWQRYPTLPEWAAGGFAWLCAPAGAAKLDRHRLQQGLE